MNVLPKSNLPKVNSISLWYLIPVALGIHGLILCIPIALNEPTQENPKSDPVKLQKLPSSRVSASPKPTLSPPPVGAVIPPVPITGSSAPPVASLVNPASVQAPVRTTPPASPVTPAPPTAPTPTPPVTPTRTETPTPERTSDAFQIVGAVACGDVKDCYANTDTNGRSVAETIVADLEKEGYKIKQLDDISSEHGIKVYEMRKEAGKSIKYLHIIWNDKKGTRALRLSKIVENRDELEAIAKL